MDGSTGVVRRVARPQEHERTVLGVEGAVAMRREAADARRLQRHPLRPGLGRRRRPARRPRCPARRRLRVDRVGRRQHAGAADEASVPRDRARPERRAARLPRAPYRSLSNADARRDCWSWSARGPRLGGRRYMRAAGRPWAPAPARSGTADRGRSTPASAEWGDSRSTSPSFAAPCCRSCIGAERFSISCGSKPRTRATSSMTRVGTRGDGA